MVRLVYLYSALASNAPINDFPVPGNTFQKTNVQNYNEMNVPGGPWISETF